MGLKSQALQRLGNAWTNNVQEMRRMDQHTDVRPRAPDQVFRAKEQKSDGTLRVDCGPAAFKLCEKAGGPPNILVGVSGWISLRESGRADVPLCTMDFGTRVAYFRSKGSELEHIYGVHYDMDETGAGHPVFHGQFRAMTELYEPVREQFGGPGEIEDCVGKVLRTVRTPTAQMDFFSVFTQLCADHLMMAKQPKGQVAGAFRRIRSACDFMLGGAHRLARLNSVSAAGCYRSTHWYR